jgi:translation elongation factor EF-1alpha
METPNKTVIEVNGVKLEVDLRTAKRIDTLAVGDRVKVLIKGYSDHKVHAGTVVGFEPFKNMPTIIVAYLEIGYDKAEVKFVYFNEQTKETEIIKAIDNDELDLDRAKVTNMFDAQIERKKKELEQIQTQREFFLAEFRNYWRFEKVEAPQAA